MMPSISESSYPHSDNKSLTCITHSSWANQQILLKSCTRTSASTMSFLAFGYWGSKLVHRFSTIKRWYCTYRLWCLNDSLFASVITVSFNCWSECIYITFDIKSATILFFQQMHPLLFQFLDFGWYDYLAVRSISMLIIIVLMVSLCYSKLI